MNSIIINGKNVPYHFGMDFTERFPQRLETYKEEGYTRMDFIVEAVACAHTNYNRMKGLTPTVTRAEIFEWVERMMKDEDVLANCNRFMQDYADSDFAKAVSEALEKFEDGKEEKKSPSPTKSSGRKKKPTPSAH